MVINDEGGSWPRRTRRFEELKVQVHSALALQHVPMTVRETRLLARLLLYARTVLYYKSTRKSSLKKSSLFCPFLFSIRA